MSKGIKPLVTRSNVRDIVLCVCCLSALFWYPERCGIVIGFSLLAIGCFVHIVSKGILVRNVVLSQKGIYSFVRHPYYLSNYLIDTGFCVLSGNPYLLVVYPFLFFWAYGPTLRKEETFLSSAHETAFARHSLEVPQIFPDRTSFKRLGTFFEDFSRRRITWKECGRIVRFISLGFLVLLIHEVKADGWVAGLSDMVQPTRMDYDEFVLAFLAIVLYGVSHLLLSRAREGRDQVGIL